MKRAVLHHNRLLVEKTCHDVRHLLFHVNGYVIVLIREHIATVKLSLPSDFGADWGFQIRGLPIESESIELRQGGIAVRPVITGVPPLLRNAVWQKGIHDDRM